MFDSEELKYLAEMEERILQQSAQNMRVILESSVDKKLNLILEALQSQREQSKDFAPSERVDELEEDVVMLQSVVKKHSKAIKELKHA